MMISKLIDFILDRILVFSDYYLVKKHVTLSECFVFMLGLSRAIWFGIFGVRDTSFDMLWGDDFWTVYYAIITVSHLVSTLFITSVMPRAIIMFIKGFTWLFLGVLAVISHSHSPAIPGMFLIALLCVFIGVRLYTDKVGDEILNGD